MPSTPIKILFLAANPSDTTWLKLGHEVREIDAALRRARYRDLFELEQHHAVRVSDVQELLLRHEPHIVHFSGHGSQAGEIILESPGGGGSARRHMTQTPSASPARGRPGYVSARALADTLAVLKDNIRCVVLNACYSETQADAIAQVIDCVVGMSDAIGDNAAISFASAFYLALAYGRDVETAFRLGKAQINLDNLGEQETPRIKALKVPAASIHFVPNGDETSTVTTPLEALITEALGARLKEVPVAIDVVPLASSVVAFLSPFLPYLVKAGEKAAENIGEEFSTESWGLAQKLWGRLKPKVEAKEASKVAAEDLASDPEDKDAQAAFRMQLKKLLGGDEALAKEVEALFKEIKNNPEAAQYVSHITGDYNAAAQGPGASAKVTIHAPPEKKE